MMRTNQRSFLARSQADCTVDWAQHIVDEQTPNVTVSRLHVISSEVGTTTRIRLAIDHDGPASLPRRWFVKLPSSVWRARLITALPRLLQTEVRFYNDVATHLPIAHPTALAAASRWGHGTTLVLEDVTDAGAVPGHSGEALSAEQASAVVKVLACLHASFWGDTHLVKRHPWLDGPIRQLENGLGTVLAVPLMRRGLQRARRVIPADLHEPALRYARYRRRAMRTLAHGPRTLVHHDCHAGNLYWQDSTPGLLDWQLVRIGEGIGDIAYLLATALEPETRRTHEEDLLAQYGVCLADSGAPRLDFHHLRQRYRAHLTYAFEAMVVTLAVGGMMDDHAITELVRRTAIAARDHHAFAAIESQQGWL